MGMKISSGGTSKNFIRGIFRSAKQTCDSCFAPFLKQLPVREMGRLSLWALRINRSALGLLLGGLILWLGVPGKAENLVKTGSGVPVRVAPAKIEQLSEIIGANSTVEPISLVNVKAKVTGNVETVMVDLGDLIQPGQLLLDIDPTLLLAAEKSAQAEMTKASTELKNSRLMLERQTVLYSQSLIA